MDKNKVTGETYSVVRSLFTGALYVRRDVDYVDVLGVSRVDVTYSNALSSDRYGDAVRACARRAAAPQRYRWVDFPTSDPQAFTSEVL